MNCTFTHESCQLACTLSLKVKQSDVDFISSYCHSPSRSMQHLIIGEVPVIARNNFNTRQKAQIFKSVLPHRCHNTPEGCCNFLEKPRGALKLAGCGARQAEVTKDHSCTIHSVHAAHKCSLFTMHPSIETLRHVIINTAFNTWFKWNATKQQ